MKIKSIATAAALACSLLAACTTPGLGGGDYNRSAVRGEQSVRLGTVMSVRNVRIEGTHSGLGGLTGAAIGGLAGHTVGGARGNDIATIAGAVVGGLAGSAVEQGSTAQSGVEVTVQFDNGRLAAITQGADEEFKVGDRVMVTSGQGVTRVTKVTAGSALTVPPPPPGSAPSANPVPPAGSAPAPGSMAPVPQQPSASSDSRWYCPNKGYYPDVPTCTDKWMKVSAP